MAVGRVLFHHTVASTPSAFYCRVTRVTPRHRHVPTTRCCANLWVSWAHGDWDLRAPSCECLSSGLPVVSDRTFFFFFSLLLGPCHTTIPPFLLDEQSSATKLVFSLSYRKRDGLGFATIILVEEQDVPGKFNQVSRPSAACSALLCFTMPCLPEVNYCWRHSAPNMGHPCSRSNRPISNINVTIPGHLLPLRPSPWIVYRPPRE